MGGAAKTIGVGEENLGLAFGHYLTLESADKSTRHRFQNYWVGEDATLSGDSYGFMPFAFSGITVTKGGDNQPATIAFPNNELSRPFATVAVEDEYLADDKDGFTTLNEYVGQIVTARWDSTSLELSLASVFDAVGADVPRKRITQQLVGHLPLTSRVRVA
jgi:hypothetical protein